MALLIESGYPVLIVDLGSGPEKIIHNKFVSDNVWRQIIIDRLASTRMTLSSSKYFVLMFFEIFLSELAKMSD